MTWIETRSLLGAEGELRAAFEAQQGLYPPEYRGPLVPGQDDAGGIVASHALIPPALRHAFSTFGALIDPALPLSRAQHEMLALRVSALNRCGYCAGAHADFLQRVTLDAALVRALRDDYAAAELAPADRAMLDYAEKLTRDASQVGRADHETLRRHGFDDRGILQITLIAAWFNYINRVADALGVGREG